jgi:hypothetical protein
MLHYDMDIKVAYVAGKVFDCDLQNIERKAGGMINIAFIWIG